MRRLSRLHTCGAPCGNPASAGRVAAAPTAERLCNPCRSLGSRLKLTCGYWRVAWTRAPSPPLHRKLGTFLPSLLRVLFLSVAVYSLSSRRRASTASLWWWASYLISSKLHQEAFASAPLIWTLKLSGLTRSLLATAKPHGRNSLSMDRPSSNQRVHYRYLGG